MEPKIIHGGISIDDRGKVIYCNEFDFKESGVRRSYSVSNHESGFIRSWHGHINESKYVSVVSGTALIGIVDLKTEKISKYILSADKPSILYIPKNYANGFKTLTTNAILTFYSTSTLEESLGDDIRYPYDKWDIWKPDYR